MNTYPMRKTHPMVLTAAIAVTVFSILGSAAITGLIPSAHSGRAESMRTVSTDANDTLAPVSRDETFKSTVTGKGEGKTAPPTESRVVGHDKPALSGKEDKHAAACGTCGVIESIRTVEREGDGSGLGAVAGGVVGGVAGNQIGKGKGNTLMTILGIGGGAYAGHTIEKNMKSTTAYIVKVRMEDGTYRSITMHNQPDYAVGDHVRVAHGSLTSA